MPSSVCSHVVPDRGFDTLLSSSEHPVNTIAATTANISKNLLIVFKIEVCLGKYKENFTPPPVVNIYYVIIFCIAFNYNKILESFASLFLGFGSLNFTAILQHVGKWEYEVVFEYMR